MIRLSKLADYAIIILTHFSQHKPDSTQTARELAIHSGIPLPTVSKILKKLHQHNLVLSHRGLKGGYALSREPHCITILEVISAIDGPMAITDCASTQNTPCELEQACPVRENWQKINHVVANALNALTLTDMRQPQLAHNTPLTLIQKRTPR